MGMGMGIAALASLALTRVELDLPKLVDLSTVGLVGGMDIIVDPDNLIISGA